jgi:hypothetical protein
MKSTCCSAPVKVYSTDEGTSFYWCTACGFDCNVKGKLIDEKKMAKLAKKVNKSWEEEYAYMKAIPSKELEKNKERILKMWETYRQENEDALHSPWVDAGRVCIALGWGLLWMGVGILIGILICI